MTGPMRVRRASRSVLRVGVVVVVLLVVWITTASVVYGPQYVARVLAMRESSQADYLERFPLRTLTASPTPFSFGVRPDDGRVEEALRTALGVDDLDLFLADSGTQALIVVEDDDVALERYANAARRDTMLTSFSVAKSYVSALVGIAVERGHLGSVDDPVTAHLPELLERDERFAAITIRDLLTMSSGLEYEEMRWALFNGDDPLTTYHPDQRAIALGNTTVVDEPGEVFSYNKYHPQLLGMVLERATGRSVTALTQEWLWDPLGSEYDGAWALDSVDSGFEKMEAGLNARAIDYAKLGRLYLEEGAWEGEQVLPAAWVRESTRRDPSRDRPERYTDAFGRSVFADGAGWYGYMWYGRDRPGAAPDLYAEGDDGQFVYVVPSRRLIVVRNGFEFGISGSDWVDAFHRFATELPAR